MINFQYLCSTKFIFGKDEEKNVGAYIKEFGGTKVLLHYYGNGLDVENRLLETVKESLNAEMIDYVELSGVQPNPKLSLALKGSHIVKEEGVDFILALGGGSVIDSAKCIAVAAVYEGDVWQDLFIDWKDYPTPIPVGVVLTSASTGSEASAGSVMTNEETKEKKFIFKDKNRPKFAIMNPELTYTLPSYQTACGAVDIISHACERYFTKEHDNYLTDMLNEAVCKTVIRYAPIALKDPQNYEARSHLMWAATMAHCGIFGVGRVEDMACHNIQQEFGGLYDSAHGAGVAAITIGWMKYVYKKDVQRFYRYFTEVWGVEDDIFDMEGVILKGIEKQKQFVESLGLPTNVRELGVKEEDLAYLAHSAMRTTPDGKVGCFSELDDEDIIQIYKLCM